MINQPDDVQLMDYADGLLNSEDRASIEMFLSANPEAKRKVEEFKLSSKLIGVAFGDENIREVPKSSLDLIKNAKPPSAKIFSFPSFKKIPQAVFSQAMAAGLAGIVIGFGGNQLLNPVEKPEILMRGAETAEPKREVAVKPWKINEMKRLDLDWSAIFEGAKAGVEETRDLSLDVKAKLKWGEPYLIEDGRLCRDVIFERIKTTPEEPILLIGCRASDSMWSLIHSKRVR